MNNKIAFEETAMRKVLIFAMAIALLGMEGCDYAKPTAVQELEDEVTKSENRLKLLPSNVQVDSLEQLADQLKADAQALDSATISLKDSLQALDKLEGLFIPTPTYKAELNDPIAIRDTMNFDFVHIWEWNHTLVREDSVLIQMKSNEDIIFLLFRESLGQMELIWWADEDDPLDEEYNDRSWFNSDILYGKPLDSGTYFILASPWGWQRLNTLGRNSVPYWLSISPQSETLEQVNTRTVGDDEKIMVNGRILNSSYKTIPDARIEFKPKSLGTNSKSTTSKADGTFLINGLPTGRYDISVTHREYEEQNLQDDLTKDGQTIEDIVMKRRTVSIWGANRSAKTVAVKTTEDKVAVLQALMSAWYEQNR